MLTSSCCDPAISHASDGIASGDYAGSPVLQQKLRNDFSSRDNWSYDPATNLCTWTAPSSSYPYQLDDGSAAGVSPAITVDAAHYGGGCTKGGVPVAVAPAPASTTSTTASYVLLAGVSAALLWYLFR